jgi:bisphosphoglycerate-dependent phosphoglycerate mutase
MTMHLLPAYFTTTRTKKKKAKASKSNDEHQKWLSKRGLAPDQLKAKKVVDNKWQEEYVKNIRVERKYESADMTGTKDSCVKKDIMSKLHQEPSHVRKEILDKASRVMPLYNKGGLQYATPETDMKMVGSKTRRG